jgi:hypothetical protein
MDKKPQQKSDEFQRFEDLGRKLVSVPKKDIQGRDKKAKNQKGEKV